MSLIEVLLQLGTVFLGAFLAFWLENFRERRQLRAWADDYLSRIREDLLEEQEVQFDKLLEETLEDYATFIALDEGYVPSEDEWESLMKFSTRTHSNYRALLESTAVRVLPAELVKALSELEGSKRAIEIITDFCSAAWQQYTVPLALKRTPISDTERRGLEYVQELFKSQLGYTKERRKVEEQVLELLGKHNLGR